MGLDEKSLKNTDLYNLSRDQATFKWATTYWEIRLLLSGHPVFDLETWNLVWDIFLSKPTNMPNFNKIRDG